MKKYTYVLWLLLLATLLHACDDMTDTDSITAGTGNSDVNPESGTAELYVLNEGLFNLNNSTLMRYSFSSGTSVKNYFRQINNRGLGDTANDMGIYGSKLYIVVNVSSQIEVMDLNSGISLAQIPMLSQNGSSRQPRYITFAEGKAYVCSFDGTVARIDTTSLTVDAYTAAGRNPDGICVQNEKLYVSNSGGLDSPNYDNTVSVIDLATFTEIKKITVGSNPGKILPDKYGDVYVVTRGNLKTDNYHFVQINSQTDEVTHVFDSAVLNFAINDDYAYLYNYDYTSGKSWIKVFNVRTETMERENFITDGTTLTTPYGINVNPYNSNIYITDAYDYKVTGDVLCFNPQGQLQFRLSNVGLNPNTIAFSDKASQSVIDNNDNEKTSPAFANKVYEYIPAPCQYMNTGTTAYKDSYTTAQVLEYATEQVKNKSLLSLGGFGGNITLGFDHTIKNVLGEYDFKIYGNAYYDMYGTATGKPGGSSEPGIVLVSKDSNGNGIPDDTWYELAGSEYNSDKVIRNYRITYYRPNPANADVKWIDNQGKEGYILRNSYHQQTSYYPAWMDDEITFSGTRLPDNAVNEGTGTSQHWVSYCFDWGYADNQPNNTEYSNFKIDWAVDANGNHVHLDGIDFVKIYCAMNQDCGWMGEASTEVSTIEDLHYTK
ncbi:YncE family protein [uncultured Bacteroides sp.]|uniref:YncE family protein n=1 Tax=uncultured Bacteroides sp. TaxID=162156 RepID=UPI002AA6F152|nr:YncE family protein [uncultured Bacteroides sp.]